MNQSMNPMTRRHVLRVTVMGLASAVLAGCGNLLNSFTGNSEKPNPLPGANNASGAIPQTPLPGEILITPNENFYTVAIGSSGHTTPADWKLTVGGNVDKPQAFALDELKKLPAIQEMRTFECISNPAGGPLISNAVWRGFKFSDLLDAVGARKNSLEVKLESFDGFYTTIPLELAYDEHAFLVYEMNGEPLPIEHGRPLRCLWPGRFGMKQPKWLQKITLMTTTSRGYWESLGWSNEAMIQVNSRIDFPEDNSTIKGEQLTVSGVAFSGRDGVSKVEISFDQGKTWQATELTQAKDAVRPFVWTNWRWSGPIPGAGQYSIRARATDSQGSTQLKVAQNILGSTFPDGTSDMHQIVVNFQKA